MGRFFPVVDMRASRLSMLLSPSTRATNVCGPRDAMGVPLTEHGATLPAASVSGTYLGHPEARYFNVRPAS